MSSISSPISTCIVLPSQRMYLSKSRPVPAVSFLISYLEVPHAQTAKNLSFGLLSNPTTSCDSLSLLTR